MQHARMNAYASLALAAAALLGCFGAAAAQGVVAQVNGASITNFDVQQRIRIEQVTERKAIDRKQALDNLIDDKLKLDEAFRAGYRITDSNATEALEKVARSNRKSLAELSRSLEQQGVDMTALRAKFQAEIAWNSLLAGKTRTRSPSNEDINRLVAERVANGKANVTDYVLNQVIFVVPLRQPQLAAQRQSEAESARAKFNGCDESLPMLRAMKDVAVKQPVTKTSSDMTKATNDILEKTGVGRLSPSFRTEQGIEAMAVCEKKDRTDLAAIRTEVETELKNQRSGDTSQSMLKGMRARATIVRH